MDDRVFGDVKFVDEPETVPRDAELFAAVDRGLKSGDLTAAVGGYIDRDGVFHIQEVSVVPSATHQRIDTLRTKIKNRKR